MLLVLVAVFAPSLLRRQVLTWGVYLSLVGGVELFGQFVLDCLARAQSLGFTGISVFWGFS